MVDIDAVELVVVDIVDIQGGDKTQAGIMIFECLYHLGVQEAGLLLDKRGGGEEQGRGDQDWG